MATTIRTPVAADAAALGRVHVRAWQAAYRGGLMPDEYLDSLSADERASIWAGILARPLPATGTRFVAERPDGKVAGFIVVGSAPGEHTDDTGELFAINVDPDHWRTGIGDVLHDAGIAAMVESGFGRAILWVHPGNSRARRFYEARGWMSDGATRSEEVLGVDVDEVRYSITLPSS